MRLGKFLKLPKKLQITRSKEQQNKPVKQVNMVDPIAIVFYLNSCLICPFLAGPFLPYNVSCEVYIFFASVSQFLDL